MTNKLGKSCESCGGQNLKSHPTTWPVDMGEKKLTIGRMWVMECLDCNAMQPTKAEHEKIARGMMAFMELMLQ